MSTDVPEFYAPDRATWRSWLARHATVETAVWLIFDKGKDRALSYDDIVEEALCFGWVDSKSNTVSGTQAKIYVSKRKPRSAWAKTNKARITALRAAGLMTPAGEAAVAVAKQNGTWDALNASDNFTEPAELTKALNAKPKARAFYDNMAPSSKRIILEWIYGAKTEATKLKRAAETAELAARGIKAHHYRQ